MIPDKISKEIFSVKPFASTASGRRCKNVPPNKVPAERLTIISKNLLKCFPLKNKDKAPTKETRDTKITLPIT